MKLKLKNPLMQISAVVSTFALSSNVAFAQAAAGGGDLNAVSTKLSGNIYSLTTVISTGSYVAGAFFGVSGLLAVKKHAESAQEPLAKGVGKIAVGAALCTLPSVMSIAINSMGISANQGVGVTNASASRL